MDGPRPSSQLRQARIPRRVAVVGSYTIVTFRGWLIENLVARGHTVFACAPDLNEGDYARLAKAGASYQRIGFERTGLNPLHDIKHTIGLAALLRRLKVDVAICHTTKAMIIGCIAARLAFVPKILSIVEGLGYAFTPGPERKRRLVRAILAPAMKASLAFCDVVFVLNSDDKACLIDLGILSPRKKVIQIAGTGLDLDHYAYVTPTPGPPRFLTIGRMVRDKGIFDFVAAAQIVKAKYPSARFQLVGPIDNHPTAVSKAEIARWVRDGTIEYFGVTDDVRPYLANCTAYVLPSYREGMPRTIMEALAVGRPVITTDVPGCREAVKNGVTGFVVAPQNVEELAAAMERVIEKPDHAAILGTRGREDAEKRFAEVTAHQDVLAAIES